MRSQRLAPGDGSLSDWVHHQLSQLILNGEIEPGQPLREVAIAEQFGTSRVPVREAIHRLAEQGWAERVPGAGVRVRVPTAKDINDLFDVRLPLELEAVRLAVARISLANSEPIRDLIATAHRCADSGDESGLSDANRLFHTALAGLSDNQLLSDLLGTLELRAQWMLRSALHEDPRQGIAEHEEILEAVLAHDTARAKRLMRAHLVRTRREFHHLSS
ncbi:GntR family transcriptional regulator [Nocardioides sp. L-11A]|uniref:GntR family transcriptional regulator n=1 Tax=Nocardioides sp. L-11A TaxID=3043848 RepID=UPI00249BE85E|nr:GntR family transcriptional regulator [Nocardioides sp. L-11A]